MSELASRFLAFTCQYRSSQLSPASSPSPLKQKKQQIPSKPECFPQLEMASNSSLLPSPLSPTCEYCVWQIWASGCGIFVPLGCSQSLWSQALFRTAWQGRWFWLLLCGLLSPPALGLLLLPPLSTTPHLSLPCSWSGTMQTCAVSCPSWRSACEPQLSAWRRWRARWRRPRRTPCGTASATSRRWTASRRPCEPRTWPGGLTLPRSVRVSAPRPLIKGEGSTGQMVCAGQPGPPSTWRPSWEDGISRRALPWDSRGHGDLQSYWAEQRSQPALAADRGVWL